MSEEECHVSQENKDPKIKITDYDGVEIYFSSRYAHFFCNLENEKFPLVTGSLEGIRKKIIKEKSKKNVPVIYLNGNYLDENKAACKTGEKYFEYGEKTCAFAGKDNWVRLRPSEKVLEDMKKKVVSLVLKEKEARDVYTQTIDSIFKERCAIMETLPKITDNIFQAELERKQTP